MEQKWYYSLVMLLIAGLLALIDSACAQQKAQKLPQPYASKSVRKFRDQAIFLRIKK